MNRSPKLLCRRRVRIVAAQVLVIGFVAVCAPVSFELSGIRIDDDNALIQIAVGDVSFVGFGIDEYLRNSAEVFLIVAAAVFSRMTVLRKKLTILGELENLSVVCAVAANPDIAFVIDGDSVIRLGPLITLTGSSPMSDQISRLIELEDRRGL